MRTKFFSYIVDNLGNAIEGARIHVYVYPLGGGTASYANIYLTDIGVVTSSYASEILTDANGYFDFYIADLEEGGSNGYEYQREFKVAWSGGGAASGSIDKLQLFDVTKREVDITGTGTHKNRLVSNVLAKAWQDHRTDTTKDEHTQYLKADGSRTLGGIWDTGGTYPILVNLLKSRPSADLVLANYSGLGLTIDKTTGKVTIPNLDISAAFTLNGSFTGVGTLSWSGASGFSGGTLTASVVDINGGAIDNVIIGAATPLAGSFTTLLSTSLTTAAGIIVGTTLNVTGGILTADEVAITGGSLAGVTINNSSIGLTNPAPGNFTTLNCTSFTGNFSIDAAEVTSLYASSFISCDTLTVSGNTILGDATGDSLTINGTAILIPNNINFDSGLMYLNSSSNRVTIGGTAGDRKLEVVDNSGDNHLRLTYSTGIYAELGCDSLGNLTATSSALSASFSLDLGPGINNTYNLGSDVKRWKDLYLSGLLDINNDSLRIRTSKTPSASGDTGSAGQLCWDEDYIYICIATNTWRRATHSSWS